MLFLAHSQACLPVTGSALLATLILVQHIPTQEASWTAGDFLHPEETGHPG